MTDELKPVRCGCGGETWVIYCPLEGNGEYVTCKKCGTKTKIYPSEAEAVEAWNKRMCADHFREVTKMMERTAKVEKVDTNSPYSQVYKCCECGQYTHRTAWSRDVVYCPSCGCRLEWE